MKVALVHDYLKEFGGAERVLLVLHEIWPEAPIYTIFCKENSSAEKIFRKKGQEEQEGTEGQKKGKVIESWFGKLPFCDRLISPLRFLIPLIWKSFDFSEYDLVISSASWAVTKGFGEKRKDKKNQKEQKNKGLTEICYCHTPPRYLYGYETSKNWKKHFWVRFYALIVNHFMRMYDFQRAQRVDFFIANSQEVAGRIKKFYRRESVVINPPVDLPVISNKPARLASQREAGGQLAIRDKKYYLTGGRLEAAKNFDLIIKACNELKLPLKVYGSGSQEKYLREIARLRPPAGETTARQAGPTVEFLGRVSDEEKFNLMANCKAFIVMAKDEDFGITPVEAMAVGAPVVAYQGGGYTETVIEGRTGVFVKECSTESLVGAIRDFRDIGEKIRPEDCRKQAEKFSKERFKKEIKEFIKKCLEDKRN